MNDELKKQRLMTFIKWSVVLVACAVVAPVAYLAILGIAGVMVAGAIGLVGINLAPVVAMKLANLKIKAIVNEAKTNPIETLYVQSHEKRQASEVFKQSITAFSTEIKNFADQTKLFKTDYPEDAERFEKQLAAMHKLLQFRESRYRQLQVELDNFDKAIARAQAMWNMSQAAQKMNKMAGMETGDPFEKIKADSAINSVMSSMNKAFAEMETALLDNEEVQQASMMVTNDPRPTLTSLQSSSVSKGVLVN